MSKDMSQQKDIRSYNSVNDSIASQRDFSMTTEPAFKYLPAQYLDGSNTEATFRKVPVQVYGAQRDIDTPDSVASTSKRMIWSSAEGGGRHMVNAANLQQSIDDAKNGAKSMREVYTNSGEQQTGAKSMRQIYTNSGEQQNGNLPLTLELPSHALRKNKEAKTPSSCDKTCCLKCGVFISCVIVFIAAVVILVYFKSNSSGESDGLGGVFTIIPVTTDKPVETTPSIATCEPLSVNLQEKMKIRCLELTYIGRIQTVVIKPPSYLNAGRNITLDFRETNTTAWIPEVDIAQSSFMIDGPEATCSSIGIYTLYFYRPDGDAPFYIRNLNITVISEVRRVNISLTQQVTDNTTDYTLGCSTNSGCEQSFVDFFAEINKEEQYLRGVNFTCSITYNDYDGYSVSCLGVIPEFLLAQFERITCKPRSRLLDDLDEKELTELEQEFELKECDLTKHCGYQCTDTGDYFAVDSNRCDIFHRCVENRVYTSYCSPGTFFDPRPDHCACKHRKEVTWCRQDGAISPDSTVPGETCANQMITRK